ncbi:MAG: isopenicillin N synthase family dioxygenase [Acidimicrobiia bacterium]
MTDIPVVDIGAVTAGGDPTAAAREIDRACREVGFFSVVHHGVDPGLCTRLDAQARRFFAEPAAAKERVAMLHGGTAWRGWFPLHGELTSGTPDHKEGYYFGRELAASDPRVRAGWPLHGPNLFPDEPATLRPTVLEYLDALEALGQRLTRLISVGLGLGPDDLNARWVRDPVVLLRLFRYPPASPADPPNGVGEHTDYGFLTMLWQDASGGLEVRTDDGWVEVPPDPDAFVCNIGDMLDRLTGGRYRSTAHRVRSPCAGDRIAIPFFFDPDWNARIDALPLPGELPSDDAPDRWDGSSVHGFEGTYGEYLLGKVSKVFPELRDAVMPDARSASRSPVGQ